MTPDPCREVRPLLGAAAVGGLEPAEERALRAHLDGCASCRAELDGLTAVARVLPLADPDHVGTRREPPAELGIGVLDRVARERAVTRGRRHRRWAAAIAAAAAVVALVVVFAAVVSKPSSHATEIAFPAANGVSARASLRAGAAGTEIDLQVHGLDDGDYYWLWLTGEDGHRIAAGTFRGTPRGANVVMTAALPLQDARRIWVTDAEDHVVLDQRIAPRAETH